MSQMSFSDAEHASKRKKTRRELFLEEMDQVIPWKALIGEIAPVYPKAGRGRQPYPLEVMLRIHLMQNWFGLSDPGMEEALYEVASMRAFAGLSLLEAIPDETTILHFRHLLEREEVAPLILNAVNMHLARKGLMVKRGTMVDATIIAAPSSTKNESGKRDPEMHQAKKGNNWHFGMKAHIGVDTDSGMVHTVIATPANESDVGQVDLLLHGKEKTVHGDAGYTGAHEYVPRRKIDWKIARRRSQVEKIACDRARERVKLEETRKAQVRARVEHPFWALKCIFGYRKVRFKGLAKNAAHVVTLFALTNLFMARRRLLAMMGAVRPKMA
jgi:IS5 family transposase